MFLCGNAPAETADGCVRLTREMHWRRGHIHRYRGGKKNEGRGKKISSGA